MDRLNVLLVVWDACRLDVARSSAPNLQELAEENLWFENAIAPAGQSLGSHVSMFSGKYPHEHGIYRQTDFIDTPLPLIKELGEQGYNRYAVSANGFAAPRYGFDRGFDEFYNTQGVTAYPEGLDLHKYVRHIREETGEAFSLNEIDRKKLLWEALTHPNPLKSFMNIAAAGISEVSNSYPFFQRIPHPRFNQYNEFCYDPEQNTRIITSLFDRAADERSPFFLFTNYMDSHHPYAPPRRYQREYCGKTFSYSELSKISELSHPWNYLERLETDGQLDQQTLKSIRDLYTGEVRTADEHFGKLLEHLDQTGLREETLIVVVADHGENLGEKNWLGERHMGHVRSTSENHLRVPMMIAHPTLQNRTVEEYVSLKNLGSLFTDGIDSLVESDGTDISSLAPSDGIVSCEVPRTTTVALADKHPDLEAILRRHLTASYAEGWKVVVSSDGSEHAWKEGSSRSIGEAPSEIVETCRNNMETLVSDEGEGRELTDAEKSHLEALGYL